MKKRLFITTVLITVLLLVALSTATFAWFSASNNVNVSIISFTASSSAERNGDLIISWDSGAQDGYEIEFVNGTDMNPMIPKNAPSIGQSYSSFLTAGTGSDITSNFHSSVQAYNASEGYYYYVGKVFNEAPYKCRSASGQEEFYLINKNEEYAMRVTVRYAIGGENADSLCVAMFADGVLVGVMSNGSVLYYGEIEAGARTDEQTSVTNVIKKDGEIEFSVPAGASAAMRMVAWYSGSDIDNDGKDKAAALTKLSFTGEYEG